MLPVIDLKGGLVVHARAGHRSHYRPVISTWSQEAHDPFKLMSALRQQLGMNEYYLADLDALEGRTPQVNLITCLMNSGYQIWLDAAIHSSDVAAKWLTQGVYRLIIAGESLPSIPHLQQLHESITSDRLVYSLDLLQGKLRTMPGVFHDEEPLAVIDQVAALGCRQFIVLDASAVGVSQGTTTLAICTQIRKKHPDCTLISGGGIRNRKDIHEAEQAGVDRVLVSTWLHQGCP